MENIIKKINLIKIPPGAFDFGKSYTTEELLFLSNKYDIYFDWFLKEIGREKINLPEFHISEGPITMGIMKSFLSSTNLYSKFNNELIKNTLTYNENVPAFPISHFEAKLFCSILSCYSNLLFDLPYEYEWEKAAKGYDNRMFPWGNSYNEIQSNTKESGMNQPLPISSSNMNSSFFNVKGMGGGVEELTKSINYPYKNSPIKSALSTRYFILRGGTCEHNMDLAMCTRRHGNIPSYYRGFRVVVRATDNSYEVSNIDFLNSIYNINPQHQKKDLVLVKLHSADSEYYYVNFGLNSLGRIKRKPGLDLTRGVSFNSEIVVRIKSITESFIECEKIESPDLDEVLDSLQLT